MPFADQVGGVAGFAEFSCEVGERLAHGQAVVPDTSLGGVTAGHHDGAGGSADGLIGDGVGEVLAVGGESVQIGRARGAVEAVGAEEVPAELIGHEDDDIGLDGRCRRGRSSCGGAQAEGRASGGSGEQELAPVDPGAALGVVVLLAHDVSSQV